MSALARVSRVLVSGIIITTTAAAAAAAAAAATIKVIIIIIVIIMIITIIIGERFSCVSSWCTDEDLHLHSWCRVS